MAGAKDAKIAQARQLAEAGKFVPAISLWRELLEGAPTSDAAIYNTIGDLCLKNKDTAAAMDTYSQAARCYLQDGFHLKAIALYKKVLKLDPNRADIYALLGDLNVVRGLMNNAVAEYVSGATTYVKAGKTMNALMLLQKVIKVDPQNLAIRRRVADLCLEEKRTDQAIEEYLRIAQEYQRLGQAEEAGTFYERILAIAPSHQEARRHAERLQASVRETLEPVVMEIEDTMIEAVAHTDASADLPATDSPGQFGEATIEFQVEGLDVAAEAFMLEVAGFPPAMDDEWAALREPRGLGIADHRDAEACNRQYDLGVAYKEMGFMADAIEEFQAAMRGPTRFVDACAMVAACYRAQQRHASAIAFLDRVLADARCVGPGVPYVKYELAVLCEETGLRERAGQLYGEIPSIRDAEARLQRWQGREDPMALPASAH